MTATTAQFFQCDAAVSPARPTPVSKKALVAGRVLGGIVSILLLLDAAMKVTASTAAVEGTAQLGYPTNVIVPLGIIQLICLALYLIPRTSVIGAILWTGYLGGAVATHVRLANPLFTHILSPVYLALLLWGALWLRDRRVREAVLRS